MSRQKLLIGIWLATMLVICVVGGILIGWSLFYNQNPLAQANDASDNQPAANATIVMSTTTVISRPLAMTTSLHITPPVGSVEADLINAVLPIRDQRLLAMRLSRHDEIIPEVVRQTPPDYQLGDTTTFWVTDNYRTPPRQFEAQATLRYIGDHSLWWVENGFDLPEAALQESADRFDGETYPTNRAFFGSEWSPGIDGDTRVHIFMGNVPGVAGYFAASNSYSRLAETYSNEREMFFINLNAIRPGNRNFDGVLSHELQHMIHWYQDRNEDTWVNEGLSELATFINGYGPSNFMPTYLARPDTQLNTWALNPSDSTANYGGGFLMMAYFLEQYGETMMQAVVAEPINGIAGFNQVLADNGYPERFNDLFADFLIANYLKDSTVNDGRWGYTSLSPTNLNVTAEHTTYPVDSSGQVRQYGADYIELYSQQPLTIEMASNATVPILNNQPHSGQFQWYAHRGDDLNTRLTRAFDLRPVQTATLNFWTWYDIETDWDYAYLSVSTDGGERWTLLESQHSATDNPTGSAFGPAYTGQSGGWLQERIDLSAYAGQEILLRFEYVTDDAVNHPGWAIDDISIPEIGFADDVEMGLNGWQAEGFVRIDNNLPQYVLVQLLELGAEPTVQRIILDGTELGVLTVDGFGAEVEQAVLIISGLTQVTTEPASYEYRISAMP